VPGSPPAEDKAFEHLLKAVELKPDLDIAYPHLLDILAARRAAGAADPEQEMEIFLLAEEGGFRDAEMDLRLGELYLEADLLEPARRRFEAALEAQSRNKNHFVARRARYYLSRIYLAQDGVDRALGLYDPAAAGAEGRDVFESRYFSARILLNRGRIEDRALARDELSKAKELQPDFAGVSLQMAAMHFVDGRWDEARSILRRLLSIGETGPELLSALGLVEIERGRFSAAQDAFQKALEAAGEPAPPMQALAHLGLGLVQDFRGAVAEAIPSYRQALSLQPSDPVAALVLARALLRSGAVDESAQLLESTLEAHASDLAVAASAARALADVETARRNDERALLLLGYAAEHPVKDAALHRKLGMLLLKQGQLEAAYRHLEAARTLGGESPELLCAAGFYHYTHRDLAKAEQSFREVLKRVPARAADAGEAPSIVRLYAERGLSAIQDAHGLEVWRDDFDRDDGEEIHRGWLKRDSYGVRIAIRGGVLRFEGAQANEADGVTRLFRDVEVQDVERISARLRFAAPDAPRVRAGIRLESAEDTASIGILLFRDFDGAIRAAVKTSKSDWEDLKPNAETDASKGKTVYSGKSRWPDDGKPHTLMVKAADASKGGKGFDLLLDGEAIAQNVPVGSFGRGTKLLQVGVSGQAERLGAEYAFDVDDFSIYRRKVASARPDRR
jgi:tetratricopeptide (TPR) repeat protein